MEHLDDQAGLHPDGEPLVAARHRTDIGGNAFDDGLFETLAQRAELPGAESRADAADVHEPSAFRPRKQQGADCGARTPGFGVADHDELVRRSRLDLDPVSVAAAVVGAVDPLADDALEAGRRRLVEGGLAVAELVLAVAQRGVRRSREQSGEDGLAFDQRYATQRTPFEVRNVEQHVHQRLAGADVRQPRLQRIEIVAPLSQDDHLAVELRAAQPQRRDRFDQFGRLGGPVDPVARPDRDFPARDGREDAVTVPLHLMQPAVARGRGLLQSAQFGRERRVGDRFPRPLLQ
jgi:hypothetical protein